jgi:hypothetical protein
VSEGSAAGPARPGSATVSWNLEIHASGSFAVADPFDQPFID